MANVIGGEFKISIPGIETTEAENVRFFASGRGAFTAILRKIISQNQKSSVRLRVKVILMLY